MSVFGVLIGGGSRVVVTVGSGVVFGPSTGVEITIGEGPNWCLASFEVRTGSHVVVRT